MDTLAEGVHIFKMLHPERIKHIEINLTLSFAHYFFTKLDFLVMVHFFHSGKREFVAIFLFAHETNRINEVIIKVEDALEVLGKFLVYTRAKLYELGNFVFIKARNLWADVVAVENLAAHGVNHLAVTVNYVIVLHNVLAGIKVEAFDTLLGILERLADGLVLNWHIIIDTEALTEVSRSRPKAA